MEGIILTAHKISKMQCAASQEASGTGCASVPSLISYTEQDGESHSDDSPMLGRDLQCSTASPVHSGSSEVDADENGNEAVAAIEENSSDFYDGQHRALDVSCGPVTKELQRCDYRTAKQHRHARFNAVKVRYYEQILCDNPGSILDGPSLGIGWSYNGKEDRCFDVDRYETERAAKGHRGKHSNELILSKRKRVKIAKKIGYSEDEIMDNENHINQLKNERKWTEHIMWITDLLELCCTIEACDNSSPCISTCGQDVHNTKFMAH